MRTALPIRTPHNKDMPQERVASPTPVPPQRKDTPQTAGEVEDEDSGLSGSGSEYEPEPESESDSSEDGSKKRPVANRLGYRAEKSDPAIESKTSGEDETTDKAGKFSEGEITVDGGILDERENLEESNELEEGELPEKGETNEKSETATQNEAHDNTLYAMIVDQAILDGYRPSQIRPSWATPIVRTRRRRRRSPGSRERERERGSDRRHPRQATGSRVMLDSWVRERDASPRR
jgi:hypothetical protein